MTTPTTKPLPFPKGLRFHTSTTDYGHCTEISISVFNPPAYRDGLRSRGRVAVYTGTTELLTRRFWRFIGAL